MRRLIHRKHGSRRGERGQALVEFALISLVFFMVVFGILDMARMFQSWTSVQHASRDAARFAITGKASCSGGANRDACITWTAKRATTGLQNGGPLATDANVAVTYRAWDYDGTTWPGSGTANKTGKQCDQLEVTVTYKHRFATPFIQALAPSGIFIKGKQRMTNEPFGLCEYSDGVG